MALYPQISGGYLEYGYSGFPILGGRQDNVLEDFEDQSLSEYGSASNWRITSSNVLEGRYSLESTDSYVSLGDDGGDLPTPRTSDPTEYRARAYAADSGDAILCTNVQDEANVFRDCYAITIDTDSGELRFYVRDNNTTRYLEREHIPVSPDVEYWPAITLTEEGVRGAVYDRDGDLIHRTDSYRDTTHSGGGLGWRSGVGATTYFDECVHSPGVMGDISTAVIDDFERDNLNPYWTNSSSGTQTTTSAAAYEGNYGMVLDGFTSVMTMPGDGLDNYIENGVEFELFVNFREAASQQYYVYLCPQSRSSLSNGVYRLEFIMEGDGYMRIRKDGTTPPGSGTGESSYSEAPNVTLQTNNWYRLLGTVDDDDGVLVDMYDASSGSYNAYVHSQDTEYVDNTNGFGFYCSGSGRLYVDEIRHTA